MSKRRMILRAEKFVRIQLTQFRYNTVSEIRKTENIVPRNAGCPEYCENIDQLDCYWTRDIVLEKGTPYHREISVLVCFRPGQMKILNSDYLEEVKEEMGIIAKERLLEMWKTHEQKQDTASWNTDHIYDHAKC